jgi:ketosteroid isomerase-like protein
MKKSILIFSLLALILVGFQSKKADETQQVNDVLDAWHLAAANAEFDNYFNKMTDDAVFIGTAPGERWDKKAFMNFSKPYFDKGKAWSFKSTKRTVSFSKDKKTAWFDEVLDTWMKDCSGSGVLVKEKGTWKIAFYDLHVLIENEKMDDFLNLRNSNQK